MDFTKSSLTDAGLPYLSKLTNLRKLVLNDTQITTVNPLAENSALNDLYFARTHVNETGMSAIGKLHLERIGFSDDDIGDGGMRVLADMTGLVTIYAANTKLTDACAPSFTRLKQLQNVDLDNTKIGDAVLAQICPTVEWLKIENTAVTDEGMASLSKHQLLQGLYLGESHITTSGGYQGLLASHKKCHGQYRQDASPDGVGGGRHRHKTG
ncbi:MAG TPA: hypothetical protein V6D22_00845 [Candidatus Obscuribacterales bacterium]